MSKIISIGTALPAYKHRQQDILHFMQNIYAMDALESRKLRFLYHQSSIDTRYSVVADYSREVNDWKFYPHSENLEPFPSLEQRMIWYNKCAAPLSVDAIRDCLHSLNGKVQPEAVTHLITVSCTGMSAPGLDLQVMEMLDLPKNIYQYFSQFYGLLCSHSCIKNGRCYL